MLTVSSVNLNSTSKVKIKNQQNSSNISFKAKMNIIGALENKKEIPEIKKGLNSLKTLLLNCGYSDNVYVGYEKVEMPFPPPGESYYDYFISLDENGLEPSYVNETMYPARSEEDFLKNKAFPFFKLYNNAFELLENAKGRLW